VVTFAAGKPEVMSHKSVADSGKIFNSPFLEAMTKTHISIPLIIFYGTGIGVILYAILGLHKPALLSVGLFLAGIIFFTLVEYLVHRYFYHIEGNTPRKKRIQYVFHGVHHDHPRDKKRLALPPLMSVLVAYLFILLFRSTMGELGYAFGGGFMVGYASYLLIHYAIHVFNPPKNFLGGIWKHHNLHHFAGDDRAFGVSSPLWDHIFNTMPRVPAARKQK
jgi:sterol desaturase/sphingolipid hydroxylase (fatty acid hydroxylase superfamily)